VIVGFVRAPTRLQPDFVVAGPSDDFDPKLVGSEAMLFLLI
jgi:hypothetical protein